MDTQDQTTKLLTYAEARERQRTHPLRLSEIPVEHVVSLPIPTLRWGGAGYAQFAAPATREPNAPVEQGAPDRWWVLRARGGALVVYAVMATLPFDNGTHRFQTASLPPTELSVSQLRSRLLEFQQAMDNVVRPFFENTEAAARTDARRLLLSLIPTPLLPQYEALSPDFFEWLTIGPRTGQGVQI